MSIKKWKKNFGIRYSALIELPYFDPVRFAVIDPMHNLFLGSAKYCMQYWTSKCILSPGDLTQIKERASAITAPYSVGRIPLKISSGFAGFSSDQWRNWTICLSPIALRGILHNDLLQYWHLFVKACTLLCTPVLLESNNYFISRSVLGHVL